MGFLAYDKNEKLAFNFKKACGLWLMAVASVIAVATLIGGKQIINMQVFSIGYIVSFFAINQNKPLLNKLSTGSSSPFQKKVALYAVILLFVLMAILGGPFFATETWRLIWLGALMATMIYLALVCAANIAVGYLFPNISMVVIAYVDAAIKFTFGAYLYFLSRPSQQA